MRYHRVPDETIRRLPLYLRGLSSFPNGQDQNINSQQLANLLHIKSPQLRKDLSYFGDFGIPGVGYEIGNLKKHLQKILRLDTPHPTALVGYGNLGAALLKYKGFEYFGLEIKAIFEKDTRKIGRIVHKIPIQAVSDVRTVQQKKIGIAILAVPAAQAQDVTDKLVEAGIGGILNFAPAHLSVRPSVRVINIDIGVSLACLPYYLPSGVG